MRMRTLHLLMICGLIAGATALQAQEELSQEEIAGQLMTWVAPVYPAIAEAAHVQGDVVQGRTCSRWPCEVDEGNQWAAHVETSDSRRAEAVVSAVSRWRRGNCGNR